MTNKKVLIARVILGVPLIVFGLNGFFNFLPMPALPMAATSFMLALGKTGYFFPFLKLTEIICGAMILGGCYLPLGLVILAPVLLNIILFHIFLAPGLDSMILPIILVAAELYLANAYKESFSGILTGCKK
jgi:putative oxidoreductase